MKYLITGTTGVVGSYIIKRLLERLNILQVDQIVSISRKYRYYYEDHPGKNSAILLECFGNLLYNTDRLITQYKPDVVIHCAGNGIQNADSKDLWKSNVDTTFNLLGSCSKLENKVRFVYCSSIVVNNINSMYGLSKLTGENLVVKTPFHNINGVSVRFPAVVGARNNHGVVKDIVEKLMDRYHPFHMKLLMNSVKPFVYAGELARMLLMLTHEKTPSIVELCPPSVLSVDQVAYLAMELTGFTKSIEWAQNGVVILDSIKPTDSYYDMYSSYNAVVLGIKDILKEEYGYAG